MRARDEWNAEIRAMPAERIAKDYRFEGPDGPVGLADLFGPHDQLIVYHFMLGPGWEEGCKACSFMTDHTAPAAVHLAHRGVAVALVSRGPLDAIQAFRKRMGWDLLWVSSEGNDFNDDFGVSVTEARAAAGDYEYNYAPAPQAAAGTELPGLSVFAKTDEGEIVHTYSTYARGLDTFIGTYRFLDIVPRGRDEQDLAYGMEWVRHHDRYDT